ncbi:ParB/RepB/Spo0J family partition protein [uncultured Pseudacidovorax sp.]|uniref:ParB/RepB/Spo0J family partition protein n=1 Tax=uncultured Pseudacidovorax sp. TaxID=679313 RepID=UPI0025DD570F|nr:ParB/RepB/Spo0J family partition protein [uncultured Pseudacidovorax sp.]
MSKKLAAKASLIQLPPLRTPPPSPAPEGVVEPQQLGQPASVSAAAPTSSVPQAPDARPKTAPGSMAVFMASQSAAVKEAEELKLKLRAFDGAVPMKALDPKRIRASRWANRHANGLSDKAFEELKADIASSGTNVQPVCVRALALGSDTSADYELVFGHRRHRACLELGIPVQAIIAEIDDKGLFEAMERENRARKNLSAWEQGMMYRRALDNGLYASQRKLAEAVGVDLSLISKSLALARLPDAVVEAFPSPLDVQFRWAQPLSEVLQRDPEGLVARAKALKASKVALNAKQVLDALLGQGDKALNRSTPGSERRLGKAGQGAVLAADATGRITLRFDPGVLTPEREAALIEWLNGQLGGS